MKFIFRLYVAGRTITSRRAIRHVEAIQSRYRDHEFQVDVIDVLENPERAEVDKILATPTLVKVTPLPQKKVIGDLGDLDRVCTSIDLIDYRLRDPAPAGAGFQASETEDRES